MSKRSVPRLFAQRVEYIDPLDCGSSVGFRFYRTKYRYLGGEITLTSCDRLINWNVNAGSIKDRASSLKKIDKAIEVLQDAKRQLALIQAKGRR